MFYALLENNEIKGYYIEDIHGIDTCISLPNYIIVNSELHDYLLTISPACLNGEKESRMYTLDDKNLFFKKEPEEENITMSPSIEDRISALEAALMGVL